MASSFSTVPARRPLLSWAVASAVLLVALALLVDWRSRRTADASLHTVLQHGITTTFAAARHRGGAPDELAQGPTTRQLLDRGGEVLSASNADLDQRLLSQSELQRVGDHDLELRRSGHQARLLGGGRWRLVAATSTAGDEPVVAVAAMSTKAVDDAQSTRRRWLVAATLVAWLALLGAARVLRRATIAPVTRLRAEVTRSVGRTRTRHVPHDSTAPAEVEALSGTINGVLLQLDASRRRERTVVAATARELDGPVRVLRRSIDEALARKRPAEQLRDVLAELRIEVGRLEGLADDLGLIAGGDAETAFGAALARESQQVAVRPVVDSAIAAVRPDAEQLDRVVRATVTTDADVLANADAVQRALDGLLRNALEHGGGDIVVLVEDRGLLVHFEVRDDGPGFPAAALAAGPESLTRSGDDADGRGLGLAVVVSVARAHGGAAGIANVTGPGGAVVGGIAWFALARRSTPSADA